jgi:AcrR family transcriptional regulator
MSVRQERSKRTRAALVAAGRKLFVEKGYFDTSTEDLVAEVGGTRGALYHHFADKRALFRAVFVEVLEDFAVRPTMPGEHEAEPLDRLRSGLGYFLTAATEPEVQRIVLIDGPTVLGWDELRALEAPTVLRSVTQILEQAMADGAIRRQPTDPLARILLGAVQEAGLMMTRADDETEQAIRDVLDGLVLGLRELS